MTIINISPVERLKLEILTAKNIDNYRNIFSFMDRLPKKVIDTYIDIPILKKSDNYKYISLANKIDD